MKFRTKERNRKMEDKSDNNGHKQHNIVDEMKNKIKGEQQNK